MQMQATFDTPDKTLLRQEFRAKRRDLPLPLGQRFSQEAAQHIMAAAIWREAATVALYMAVRGEADTAPLLDDAFSTGKTVLLPRCSDSPPGVMRMLPCTDRRDLRSGPYGIPEPPPAPRTSPVEPRPDLIIVPGLAFDSHGGRLGMGGGYYDRLFALPTYAACTRLGFAYSLQRVERLPREPWDMPIHGLCTEKGLQWFTTP